MSRLSSPKFAVGSPVFVKMRGYPAWPAKVEGIADETPNKVKYHIFFFGTNQIAVSKEEDLCSYLEFRESLGKPKKAKGFNEGILEMDRELGLVPNTSNTTNMELAKKSSILEESNSIYEEMIENDDDEPFINTTEGEICAASHDQLSILKLQAQIVAIDFHIQSSLNLKEADPKACLAYLNELSNLNFNKLVLKKHPEVVNTLIKLQNYDGNIQHWNMTPDDIKIFRLRAQQIREESKLICEKIQTMFQVPEGISFLDYFEGEINQFKSKTKGLTLEEVLRLTRDPTN